MEGEPSILPSIDENEESVEGSAVDLSYVAENGISQALLHKAAGKMLEVLLDFPKAIWMDVLTQKFKKNKICTSNFSNNPSHSSNFVKSSPMATYTRDNHHPNTHPVVHIPF